MLLARAKRLSAWALALIVLLGLAWRFQVAVAYQSRAWIDEVWVMLNPAYRLLTGTGWLAPQDWEWAIRSWIPPSVLFVFLKALDTLGVHSGLVVLPLVRVASTLVLALSFLAYCRLLQRRFDLKALPWLPALFLFGNPELVRYGVSLDLNVIGTVPLLLGLWLALVSPERRFAGSEFVGYLLLAFSAIVRFQYGVFPAVVLIGFAVTRQWRRAALLAAAGGLILGFHVAFDSLMYGRAVFPLWNYFYTNVFLGQANTQGTTPFHHGFELLWRLMMEPAFVVAVLTVGISLKKARVLTVASLVFLAIHLLSGNKQLRYFIGMAVLFSGLAGAALQAWVEEKLAAQGAGGKRLSLAVLIAGLVVAAYLGVATWRAEKKVRWADYDVPSYLETVAGSRPDARGLISYGWGGIYSGGNYTFYRPLPYAFAESISGLRTLELEATLFNYVVAPASEPAPCAENVAERGGAILYRCAQSEVQALVTRPVLKK